MSWNTRFWMTSTVGGVPGLAGVPGVIPVGSGMAGAPAMLLSTSSLTMSSMDDSTVSSMAGSDGSCNAHARSAPRYTSRRRDDAPRHLAAISRAYTSEPPNLRISASFCGLYWPSMARRLSRRRSDQPFTVLR